MRTLRQIVPEAEQEAADELNHLLATALYFEDLYKRYHWYVSGPHFQPLHEMFDEHMETLEHEIDDFGERVKILGGKPIWDPKQFADQDILPEPNREIEKDLEIAREAFEMQTAYADALRKAAASFDDKGLFATHDLIVEYLRQHELQAWFLREFIRKVNIESYEGETFA